ncbi:MAG: vitamin K epoxide reductase family protein [Verrucomicrobiales bacterium]
MIRTGFVFVILALFIALYLLKISLSGANHLPGCSEGGACSEVLSSEWAYIGLIPVSATGAALYLALLIAAWWDSGTGPGSGWRKWALPVLAWTTLAGAMWFMVLQAFVIGHFCPWCSTAHLCAAVGSIFFLVASRKRSGSNIESIGAPAKPPVIVAAGIGLFAVAAFSLLQHFLPGPERSLRSAMAAGAATADDQGGLHLYGGDIVLSDGEFPGIGAAMPAPQGVLVMDYTCPHCRGLYLDLQERLTQHEPPVGLVLVPGFTDSKGRALQQSMLTLWKALPAAYPAVAGALADGSLEPTVASVRARVERELRC